MAGVAEARLSVPIKLLLEGISHTVTVEMKNGESYRGELVDAEECMNVQMAGVVHTARNGQKRKLEQIFLRGANVKLIVLPDVLKEATLFRKVVGMKKKDERKASSRPAGRTSQRGQGRGRGVAT